MPIRLGLDMGPIISGGTSRPADRYLLPYEQQLITIRRHPAILFGPSLVVLVGLVAAGALTNLFKFSGYVLLAIWLAWGVLLLRLIWKVINGSVEYYIVTPDRMLIIRGVLARDIAMIPFAQLIDINFERPERGRRFGYGSFILEVAYDEMPTWKIDFLPYPEQLFLEVLSIVNSYLAGESDGE